MINDAYFRTLEGHQSERHMELLPLWARQYERELRAVATWWSIRQRHKRRRPTLAPPKGERLLTLPLWAQAWLATLRFEVYWQQEKAEPVLTGPSRLKLFVTRSRARSHKSKEPSQHVA